MDEIFVSEQKIETTHTLIDSGSIREKKSIGGGKNLKYCEKLTIITLQT